MPALSPTLRLFTLLALPLGLSGGAEASALRWEPAAGGAAIVLPVPAAGAKGITGASLFCRAQEWAFLLRTDRAVPAGAQATVAVGEDVFPLAAQGPTVPLPRTMLAALKDGTAVTVTLGEGETALAAKFPLAGSRTAIEAVAPLCSPPAVAGFEAVTLSPAGEAAEEARPLVAAESALFREATSREPSLAAGLVAAEGGRKLLFASLCGSNRYYGESGCKLMGFAAEVAGAWKPVYETEGMHLFRDPRTAHDGWPDLLTLTLAEGERLGWSWNGEAYEVQAEPAVAGDPPAAIDELRTGTTE